MLPELERLYLDTLMRTDDAVEGIEAFSRSVRPSGVTHDRLDSPETPRRACSTTGPASRSTRCSRICATSSRTRTSRPCARWREAGGKVVGHFQVYFPEEIAHAAGLLPVKMRGAQIEARQAEAHFGSYLCSIVKTSLELALGGRLELDMFVTHPICDAARNLAAIWGRNIPYPCQILYLPQNANSAHCGRLPAARVRPRCAARSRRSTARGPSPTTALRRRSTSSTRTGACCARSTRSSASGPGCIAAGRGLRPDRPSAAPSRARSTTRCSRACCRSSRRATCAPAGSAPRRLRGRLLRAAAARPAAHDRPVLLRRRRRPADRAAVDRRRTWPPAGDPLHALADAYLEQSTYSPVQHDLRKPKEKMLLERIRRVGRRRRDRHGREDVRAGPRRAGRLRAGRSTRRSIPYFVSEFEESMTSFEHLQIQLETFVENVMFA